MRSEEAATELLLNYLNNPELDSKQRQKDIDSFAGTDPRMAGTSAAAQGAAAGYGGYLVARLFQEHYSLSNYHLMYSDDKRLFSNIYRDGSKNTDWNKVHYNLMVELGLKKQ